MLKQFLTKYKSQLNQFSNEVYTLEFKNKKEFYNQASNSFRDEISDYPQNEYDKDLLIIQFLMNELDMYEYVDNFYEDKGNEKLIKELDRLNKYF